jgi:hypothetical protein
VRITFFDHICPDSRLSRLKARAFLQIVRISIHLPASVEVICGKCFSACHSISSILFDAASPFCGRGQDLLAGKRLALKNYKALQLSRTYCSRAHQGRGCLWATVSHPVNVTYGTHILHRSVISLAAMSGLPERCTLIWLWKWWISCPLQCGISTEVWRWI